MSFKLKASIFAAQVLILNSLGATYFDQPNTTFQHEWYQGKLKVIGEFIYWRPQISGMPYAVTFIPTQQIGYDDITLRNVSFDFAPGFRVGVGYALPCSGWDLLVQGDRLETTGKDAVQIGQVGAIGTIWDNSNSLVPQRAASSFRLLLEEIEIDLGKTIQTGNFFTLRPFFGFQFYRLNLQENLNFIEAVSGVELVSNVELLNKLSGWGVRVGFDASWNLPLGFALYGKTSYGLINSKFSTTDNQAILFPSKDLEVNSKNNQTLIKQNIKIEAGVSYENRFHIAGFPLHLSLFAGYEFNYWPNQVQIARPIPIGNSNSFAVPTLNGDIGFQGLTCGMSVAF